LVLAAWLRGVQMNESLWLDELHTAWTVCDGWGEIPWRAEIGNQSPLYFYGVALTTRIGGLSEVTLRLPSALAGVALVGLAGWLVARWTGLRIAGLLTALLVAVDHTVLFYAQEARPYAWVQLLGLIHVAAFVQLLARPQSLKSRFSTGSSRIRENSDSGLVGVPHETPTNSHEFGYTQLQRPQSGWRALWIASAIAMYYLHYTAALLLVAEVVAYGVLWAIGACVHASEPVPFSDVKTTGTGHPCEVTKRDRHRASMLRSQSRFRRGGHPLTGSANSRLDLSLVALGMLPSIPHVAQIAARRDAWSMFIGNDPAPARIFSLFPLDIYLLLPAGIGIAAWAWRLKKGTGVFFAQTACRRGRSPHENDSRPLFSAVVAVCWLFVPVMLAWVLTVADIARLFFLRYLVVSAIAPAVLTGLMLRLYPGRLSRVAGSVAVAVALAWHSGLVQQYALDGRVIGDRRQDWRGAVTSASAAGCRERRSRLRAQRPDRSRPSARRRFAAASPVLSAAGSRHLPPGLAAGRSDPPADVAEQRIDRAASQPYRGGRAGLFPAGRIAAQHRPPAAATRRLADRPRPRDALGRTLYLRRRCRSALRGCEKIWTGTFATVIF
jgi:hypothetical protein